MLSTLKHTLRQLARSPLFTSVTVLTLALGLGVNAAIFTLVRSILLRDLPYAQPQELVSMALVDPSGANLPHGISGPEYRQLIAATKTLKSVAVYSPQWNVTVQGPEQTSGEFALYVSGNFFATLGVQPTLGRALTVDDDRAEAAPVVVVSDSFWRRYLAASPSVLGTNIVISGTPMTVVGVMPASFEFGETVNCWMPMAKNSYNTLARVRLFNVFGRLAAGATATQATAETNALIVEFAKTNNNPLGPRAPLVTNLHEQIIRRVRPALLAIQTAGALLLAATCANLLLLLFARHSAREREFGVRLALGASPLQIARLIISETTALALLGGGLGVLLAMWSLDGLLALAPASLLPRRPEIGLDGTVLLFAALLALGGTLYVGALAAWRRRKTNLNAVLKSGGRSPAAAGATSRSALVITEIAVAIVLLSGIGLLGRSLVRLLEVPPGFNSSNLVSLPILTSSSAYGSRDQRITLYQELERRLGAVPGVASIGAVNRLPFLAGGPESGASNVTSRIFIEGRDYSKNPQGEEPDYRVASPSYFSTMQIPLRAGRLFTWNEANSGGTVAVVNEAFAQRFWTGENALGKRFKATLANADTQWIEVIGIVGNVRHFNLEIEPRPELYRPYAVSPMGSPILALRLSAPTGAVVPALRAALRELDPSLAPATGVAEMDTLIARSHAQRRFLLIVLGVFGVLTVLLSILGIYGVVSQFVIDRRFEFATRAALGASPGDLMRLVLGRWVALALPGLAIGIAGSFAAARLLQSLLYGTSAHDPVTLLAAAALIAAVALSACWFPARRAAKADPMQVLRSD